MIDIRRLIDQYLQAAGEVTSRMAAAYGVDNVWLAYIDHRLPKRGPLSSSGGGEFRFHGVGCHFRSEDINIEIDFEPSGQANGFDAYRLVHFARNTLGLSDTELRNITGELNRMYDKGELRKDPKGNPLLYYLAKRPAPT